MRDFIGHFLRKPASILSPRLRQHTGFWFFPVLCLSLFVIMALRPVPSGLQRVFDRGELVVVTRADPIAFYTDQHGDTGFDYELARRFANSLGVKLKIIQADNIDQVYSLLIRGQADIAAAGLTANPHRQQQVRFSSGYLTTGSQFVYRMGDKRPARLSDLNGHSVAVLAGSSNAFFLARLSSQEPDLRIQQINAVDSSRLLAAVDEGEADYALIDNHAFILQHPLFPEVSTAFRVSGQQQFAWATRKQTDSSLYQAVSHFLQQAREQGTLQTLIGQFLGKHNAFNLYASRVFIKHLDTRLPKFSRVFYRAGKNNQLDWRLLAAMGYQESHWNPSAQSPTGVRGLMMLTRKTAGLMGVDRDNAKQSINGGARYLRHILDNLPTHIRQPDRTWMAIAAYNIGSAHLEDARVLTQSQGGNPDSWHDVKARLPLLAQPRYGKYLPHGMADGPQAVTYVTRVRHYYNLLVWAENGMQGRDTLLASTN
jgi:membrane-bound lytic murein transglycosylase F